MVARHALCFVALLPALIAGPRLVATAPATAEAAEQSMKQFLAQGDAPHAYRAVRRLEARHGNSTGWMEARTEFSPTAGFRYEVLAEGGSSQLREKALRAVLEGERALVEKGGIPRSSLAPCNYEFQATGIDPQGLATVLLSPRRKEHVLVAGTLFLRPVDGEIVRVQGRLAKSPSFWVKTVDIVKSYDRIEGVVMPVALESNAELRLFGDATLRMTWKYDEIDGRRVQTGR